MAKTTIHLGVLSNRHPMPVHEYLISHLVYPGQRAYDRVYTAACRWAARHKDIHVALYYTGLTEATLAALDGLSTNPTLDVTPMRYDTLSGSYEPLARKAKKSRPRKK